MPVAAGLPDLGEQAFHVRGGGAIAGLGRPFEGLRRIDSGRGLVIISASLLVDGLYLAWVMYVAGGTSMRLSSTVR